MSSSDQEVRRCPECGAIMTKVLPEEVCPACMMRKGLVPTASEAAEQLAATRTSDDDGSEQDAHSFGLRRGEEDQLADGQLFGDYTIVRRLGRGGMGTVYEADHRTTGRRVALKVLSHSLDNEQARARFLREGRLAASINHPNSVYVYGTEQIGETPTISMELIHGGTLQQWVKSKGNMEVTAAVDAVLQIIDGLEAADRKGVLHRDVKPANCFVDAGGTIKIGDFGLSISTEARDDLSAANVTCDGAFLGTPAFASPEQLRGEPLDRRSDIYAVGVTLFYLLTGKTPFSGENMVQLLATVLDKPAPSVKTIRPEVPEELDLLVQRCLQKSPGQRFPSYDALREALLPLSSRSPAPAPLGNRLVANLIDLVLLVVSMTIVIHGWQWLAFGRIEYIPRFGSRHAWYDVAFTLVTLSTPLLYYLLCEWRLGKTLGKHLLRLRVTGDNQRITFRQAAARSGIFVIIPNLPAVAFSVATRGMTVEMLQQSPVSFLGMAVGLAYYVLKGTLFCTARSRNGYAGIHDLVSGTRVVCKLSLPQRPVESKAEEKFDAAISDRRIGPYHVLQTMWASESDQLVMAYDRKLLRRVWLLAQAPGSREVDPLSRNLARASRLRWLGARRTESECWDCYEAPEGKPFTAAIDDGLRWEAIVSALRQLSHELPTAADEGSLPADLSLDHLWLTNDESLKLLPFAMHGEQETEDAPPTGSGATSKSDQSPELKLLHDAARYCYRATSVHGPSQPGQGASLSGHDGLLRICQTADIAEATGQLDRLAAQPIANARLRGIGMQLVSLAIPAVLIASSLVVSLVIEDQKARMPKVAELSKIILLIDIESRLHRADLKERVEALETLIAADYRDLISDEEKMSSQYAMMVIPQSQRGWLARLVGEPPPSPAAIDAARRAYDEMMSETRVMTPAEMGFFSFSGFAFVATIAWMEFIWAPSLIAALACRGGLLMRVFGLALVNRRGQRASRLRVFARMFAGGIPAMLICVIFVRTGLLGGDALGVTTMLTCAVIVAVIALLIVGRNRTIQDRLAGTFLVAR